MADRILDNILDRLAEAKSGNDRNVAVEEFKHMLTHNRHDPDLTYHKILEALFELVSDLRSTYLKTSVPKSNKVTAKSAKGRARDRLASCATIVRLTVEACARQIKTKTIRALVNHILQSLSAAEGNCEALTADYIKCLRIILEYQPHVEHLTKKEWENVLDFCIEGIVDFRYSTQSTNGFQSTGTSGARGTPDLSTRSTPRASVMRESSNMDRNSSSTSVLVDELILCLRHLTSATNAPVLDQAQRILSTLIEWLQAPRSLVSAHIDAFSAINSILSKTSLDSITITQQAIHNLIPIMRNFWSTKLALLKDEMLSTLIIGKAHIARMFRVMGDDADNLRFSLGNLVETMQAEYVKRIEREQLQIDDLRLRSSEGYPFEQSSFILTVCRLRPGNSRIEHNWTLVYFMAYLSVLLDSTHSSIMVDHSFLQDADDVPNKKQRTLQYLQDYLRELSNPHQSTRVCASQILTFMFQQIPLDVEDIRLVLEKLTAHISDGNAAVSNWAMLATASCAVQRNSASLELKDQWSTIWQLASRNINVASSCRVAAHTMDMLLRLNLVNYMVTAETIDAMLASVELRGPAVLSETSSSLWATIADVRSSESPHTSNSTNDRILRWLFTKWTPSNFHERSYTSQNSHHCDAWDIARILFSCADRPMPSYEGKPFSSFGPLAVVWTRAHNCPSLTDYLLLLEENKEYLVEPRQVASTASNLQQQRSARADRLILDYCISEVGKTTQRFKEWSAERSQSFNNEMVRSITTLCIISSQLSAGRGNADDTRNKDLRHTADGLIRALARFVARSDSDQLHVDAVLEVIAPSLPNVTFLKSFDSELFDDIAVTPLVLHLSRALEDRRRNKDAHRSVGPHDPMEIDDEFESQISNGTSKYGALELPRSGLAAETNLISLRSMISAKMFMLSSAFEALPVTGASTYIPQDFLKHMLSLPADDFMACRRFIVDLLSSPLHTTDEHAESILEYATREFLQNYELERNEVAIGLCVEIMTGTASSWGNKSSSTYDLGADIYEWLIKKPLKAGAASASVQVDIANLFQKLLQVQPEYAQDLEQVPSVRTSLFEILQSSDIPVKYHIIDRLSTIFETFVLSKHEAIFDDVFQSLPENDRWMEGMALRLFAFARLGSSWHTLLRRCVYHTFEQAGLVKETESHAAYCMRSISKALELDSPQTLFRLFAPQYFYTWLVTEDIKNIPYRTFGYDTLAHLLEDVQDEVYGQLLMRGKGDAIPILLEQLGVAEDVLLCNTFAKAAAYTIAWDTCMGSGRDKSIPSNEAHLRKLLQTDQYQKLAGKQFPCVLGTIICSLRDPERAEKSLSRNNMFESVGHALNEIQGISTSAIPLPADQQPSFDARYIFDEIRRLCKRAGYEDPTSIWSPDCFTYVMRMLLTRIHPALGSLHACSVIRKIRFLVCLAGPVVFEGYPLQMTLSTLRPYLTDNQCADDTLGIIQYLLDHGKPHLMSQLSFVAGISISILISLRVFLSSSQDSTTQESQHLATMQKAQAFHDWFTAYLESYTSELLQTTTSRSTTASLRLFQSMIRAACKVRTIGNAIQGSPESKLLQALLEDERDDRRLLDGPSQNLAYSLLCRQFQAPLSFREDILGLADNASTFAAQVWKSTKRADNSEEYLVWTARALGRSYSASGQIKESLHQATKRKDNNSRSQKDAHRTSRMSILQHLADLLQGDRPYEAGIAEETLRTILSSRDDEEELSEAAQVLSRAIIYGLTLQDPFDIPLRQPQFSQSLQECALPSQHKEVSVWISNLCISLAMSASDDRVAAVLPKFLSEIRGSGEVLFPYILHVALERNFDGQQTVKATISDAFRKWLHDCRDTEIPYVKVILDSILYLRTQPVPRESTIADRVQWLDIDWLDASQAAVKCGMYRAALLLAEMHGKQPVRTSRRSSVMPQQQTIPLQLQLSIYKNLDEPDYFYGAEQEPSLTSVLDRLDYESEGFKGLLFRSARMDSQMRRLNNISASDSRGIIRDLTVLNLNSLTQALLSNESFRDTGDSIDSTLEVAQKLEQWDIRAPATKTSETTAIYKAFQGIKNAPDLVAVRKTLDRSFLEALKSCSALNTSTKTLHSSFRTLAVLNDIDEILSSREADQLRETWDMVRDRGSWMKEGRFDDVRPILSSRETLFSLLSRSTQLQSILHTGPSDLLDLEVKQLVDICSTCRKHGALQESLATATYLADIVESCREVGLDIEAIAQFEVASVLWDQGETTTSIRMFQQLEEKIKPGDPGVERSVLLATLGHHVGEARLEKPDEIMAHYMEPAIKELKTQRKGKQAGQVFHQFAAFCDKQLQSQEIIDDMNRMKQLAERKEAEAQEYDKLAKTAKSTGLRDHYRQSAKKSRKWYDMDMKESQRIADSRVAFLRQSLENYLLCLQACDSYDNDVFRMFAMWFEFADLALANTAVSKHIENVPSGKFVPLMNQVSSRLQAERSHFQQILSRLVHRICVDHPYHGMHHIFSGGMGTPKDEGAKSRNTATKEIAKQLKADKKGGKYWERIRISNSCYHDLANTQDGDFKAGRSLQMENYAASKKLITQIPGLKVPPITFQVAVRHNLNYNSVPRVASFRPTMTIANGLSTPKIVTAIGTDGRPYKQLYKSGNDDLRQDAIMEQVFEHVSQLLQNHTATRLRNLHIRTYRVIPLSNRSGVIEFVQNTLPVMSYLDYAHQTYYPRDWKQSRCREKVANVAAHSTEERVKAYQEVCRHFNPVLRYFFLERFQDPDEWFEKRLAYTRSTAAISILGHVLGLGDRHCHNILLDEKSGEAVHIDLGVAFEAGRVLPVPEVVPFRLTRDIVDAMGYTGVEGVFRRCCEFTMETLRNEKDSIMTILNVLRYDPLYSWSLSPLKAKKMQEEQDQAGREGAKKFEQEGEKELEELQSVVAKKKENEVGEAARALSVVERKLSKALSSSAAVSELIQVATDERNLAVLYCGWSAWC